MSKRKIRNLGAVLGFAALSLSLGASQESQQMDPVMMEAYMKMMAVTENHVYLKSFVGEWNAATTAWMQPGAEPEKTNNFSKAEMILGGRFLKVDFKGVMMGQPFEGLQIVGFDNMKKKYISFWIDSSSTAFFLTEGTRDENKNVVTETGEWPDPMTGGTMKVRMVTTLVNPDEYTFELYMTGPDGKEMKAMESRSTRK